MSTQLLRNQLSGPAVARYIDHTYLKADARTSDIDCVCDEAVKYGFWGVCVPPSYVKHAVQRIRGSAVRMCTVDSFPLGFSTPAVKLAEARKAIEDGADEVDMVMNVGAFKSGGTDLVFAEIREVADHCKASGRLLKVIIECCYLNDEEKARAARLAELAGAHYVKTSTGFGPGGATVADVALIKGALTMGTKVKAAGGIGTLAKALDMIQAGADRIGTSAGARIMEELEAYSRRT